MLLIEAVGNATVTTPAVRAFTLALNASMEDIDAGSGVFVPPMEAYYMYESIPPLAAPFLSADRRATFVLITLNIEPFRQRSYDFLVRMCAQLATPWLCARGDRVRRAQDRLRSRVNSLQVGEQSFR